jgi:hypothetical protein
MVKGPSSDGAATTGVRPNRPFALGMVFLPFALRHDYPLTRRCVRAIHPARPRFTVMVKINRVYTRTGDDGRTMLGDGARMPKFHIRVAATGSVDQANAFIGWASRHVGEPTRAILQRIQNDLFDIGADLCRPERSGLKVEPLRLQENASCLA